MPSLSASDSQTVKIVLFIKEGTDIDAGPPVWQQKD
jgi:hypothetical protein